MKDSDPSSADIVRGFFAAFGRGDLAAVLASFHPACAMTAVRAGARTDDELYGSYRGREGAEAFVSTLGRVFDTKAFSVDHVIGEGNLAFASGSFVHELKATKKPFASAWALKCVTEDDKIREYHFFEDSAAYVEASRPG